MRQVLLAGAAIAAAGLIALVPARASEMAYEMGGPIKKGNMCQVTTGGDSYYGYWHPCPGPAKVVRVKRKKARS